MELLDGNAEVISNRTIGAAKLELKDILDQMTPLQRAKYRARIIAGHIDGSSYHNYVNGRLSCGCAYGTAAIVKRAQGNTHDWIKVHFPRFSDKHYSPLERIAFPIDIGDTPDTFDNSKWLLDQVDAYLSSHQ